ncbi:O-methyltransferase [Devosia algicola]|uniref:O-methyltransferase n=1 Tax=Devosia algicola TaxID=3026418 RepID=A0ABY7YPP0_9HYPH|nr:O-methyltransferase [Devosia algicola]WDR03152.1 O-methyltransferase [Devosia algicola]
MSAQTWHDVDQYIADRLIADDPVLASVLEANANAGLPAIDVSAAQGKLLHLMVRISGARRILEIGTLGGYSAIWMARALPDHGQLVTMEFEERHAAVAKTNIKNAGLSAKVDIRVGKGADLLPKLASEGGAPFDLIFIDADKPSNPIYLDWALKLSRSGTVIICDNVIREGGVIDATSDDVNVNGARAAFDFFANHSNVTATAIQTVGAKNYDGFAIAIVD